MTIIVAAIVPAAIGVGLAAIIRVAAIIDRTPAVIGGTTTVIARPAAIVICIPMALGCGDGNTGADNTGESGRRCGATAAIVSATAATIVSTGAEVGGAAGRRRRQALACGRGSSAGRCRI